MSNSEVIRVVQAGATGPVAEAFRAIIAQPEVPLSLEAVAASTPAHIGKKLGEIAAAPPGLEDVPVISLDDAIHNTASRVVFSGLRNEEAAEYEDLLARGRVLATNAGVNRMRPDVALFNAYIKSPQLYELSGVERPGYIIANGNCTSIFLSVALAPLRKAIGISRVEVETWQGWSGAGRGQVPEEYADQVIPIEGDEKEKIETEPRKFLSSMQELADIAIQATPKRGPWVTGHYERVRVELARTTTTEEVNDIWRSFRSPRCLHGLPGKCMPARSPIQVLYEGRLLDYEGSVPKLGVQHPMKVQARVLEVDPEDGRKVEFEISGHNLILGAAGASIMNVLYLKRM